MCEICPPDSLVDKPEPEPLGPSYKAGRTWTEDNPEKMKARQLRYKCAMKGISVARFEEMLNEQNGLCAICNEPETKTGNKSDQPRQLTIDHDHACCPGSRACGSCVRGLLCSRCNLNLGNLRDDVTLLKRAIEYLTK